MKKLILIIALALSVSIARATPITGNLALAGVGTYTSTSFTFNGPAFVLVATGSLSPLLGLMITPHNFAYSTAPGEHIFTSPGVTLDVLTMLVVNNNSNFLNIKGTMELSQPGFDDTMYAYTMTATRPDGVSSYTLTAVPAAAIPEPVSLILVGTGLLVLALAKRRAAHGAYRNPKE